MEPKKGVPIEEKKLAIDEFQCAICLGLLIDPTFLPCRHKFCNVCIRELLDINIDEIKCPLCRNAVPESFKLEIDENVQKIIKDKFPIEQKERFDAAEKQKKDLKNLIKVKFLQGNTHLQPYILNLNRLVAPDHSPAHNSHDWKLFIKAQNDNIENYVEKVVFKLHETFHPSNIELKRSPFEVRRLGWGVFLIPIRIYWKKWLQKEEYTEITHYLSFDGEGETKIYMLRYSNNLKPS